MIRLFLQIDSLVTKITMRDLAMYLVMNYEDKAKELSEYIEQQLKCKGE